MSRCAPQQSPNFVSWWQTLSYRDSPHLRTSALSSHHTRNLGDGSSLPQPLSPPPIDQEVYYHVPTSRSIGTPPTLSHVHSPTRPPPVEQLDLKYAAPRIDRSRRSASLKS